MEEQHGEAELVAVMACFGAARLDEELDGGRGGLRLDLGLSAQDRGREGGGDGFFLEEIAKTSYFGVIFAQNIDSELLLHKPVTTVVILFNHWFVQQ